MTPARPGRSVSRRALLTGTMVGTVAGAGLATGAAVTTARATTVGADFYGTRQAGIITPPLPYLSIAGFDVVARDRAALAALLQTWTHAAAGLCDHASGQVTVTFGVGPALFAAGRFGLTDRRPDALVALPPFPGEALDPAAGDGDLCVQVCAATPTAAHQAIRTLVNTGRSAAALRWRQTGFRPDEPAGDPRGLFGFRDGTANIDVSDPHQTAEHLWVAEGPAWLHGGTYLVMRRIRLLLDTWDRTAVAQQEAMIGRRRDNNVRLTTAPTTHSALAAPSANGGARLLRRSYSYDAGADPNGLMDAGLIFLCFQRDPRRQFVPVQQRLADHDPLNGFSQHLASGVFACPPGIAPGSWIGAELLA